MTKKVTDDSQLYKCGQMQSITHIAESCSSTKFERDLVKLHKGETAAAKWLEKLFGCV